MGSEMCIRDRYTSTTASSNSSAVLHFHKMPWWMDRFVGVTAVLPLHCCCSTAVLLLYRVVGGYEVHRFVPVVCCCRVSTRLRGFFSFFFSRYSGPALAWFSVPLVYINSLLVGRHDGIGQRARMRTYRTHIQDSQCKHRKATKTRHRVVPSTPTADHFWACDTAQHFCFL